MIGQQHCIIINDIFMKKVIVTLWLSFAFGGLAFSQVENDLALPVRMASMQAVRINESEANLKWQVICRVAYAKFEIQKSRDGIIFETIDSFQADKIRCQSPFDYLDRTAAGQSFYRIRVGDIDGQFTSEKIVFVSGIKPEKTKFMVSNPIQYGQIQVRADIQKKQTINFLLMDAAGRRVYSQQMEFNEGTISFNWLPPVQWSKGYYTLVLMGADFEQVIRLLKF
jgi:hypothetical protein